MLIFFSLFSALCLNNFFIRKAAEGSKDLREVLQKRVKKRFADVCWLKKTIALVRNMRFSLPTIMPLVVSHKRSMPLMPF